MVLTFLNLVVVRGILVGIIQGSTDVYKTGYAGDILITPLPKKDSIENSPSILATARALPWAETVTYRFVSAGTVEANYKTKLRETDEPNSAIGSIVGINPIIEDEATNLRSHIVEGEYLTLEDSESIIIGANFFRKYLDIEAPGLSLLEDVEVGDMVRLTIGQNTKELRLKGILQSKVDQVDFRMFVLDTTLRSMAGQKNFNVDEISIFLKPGSDPEIVKAAMLATGAGDFANVQTWEESLPKFLLDIKDTFGLLGNVVGSIGLVAASITIFIIIFVNAITRRKFIGILKGIGIDSRAVEFSYVLQAFFYALIGIGIGLAILYGFLVPFVTEHPIKFPFSDGILVAEIPNTMIRAAILMVATVIAGYIPARIVVKQNTLDAILGRK